MRTWLTSMLVAAPLLAPVAGAGLMAAGQADQAQEVLAKVREALGGEAKLAAVKSVFAEGTYRRVMGENEMSGDLEITLVLPDKFQRVEQMAFGGQMGGPRIATTMNGTEAWSGPLGPMPPGMQMRFGGGGPGGPGGGPAGATGGAPGAGGQGGRQFDPLQRIRPDFYRTALALLPGSAATSGLTFTYVGKAESPDGEAEVLDVKGEGNFAARLFIDATSHLPIMLTYKDRDMTQMRFQRPQRRDGETEEAFRARMDEERKKREAAGPPPPAPLVEYSMFIAEHTKVDGVRIPTRITMQTGDKPSQEWELKKFKVNGKIDDEQFKRKSSN